MTLYHMAHGKVREVFTEDPTLGMHPVTDACFANACTSGEGESPREDEGASE